MSQTNIEPAWLDFLTPIDGLQICGPELDYDPAFMELERALTVVPEQQIGAYTVPARHPDWPCVQGQAEVLMKRTLDLRVAIALTRAWTWTIGIVGTSAGLQLVDALLARHWDEAHPVLDPDDGDPVMRLNALDILWSDKGLLGDLRRYRGRRDDGTAQASRRAMGALRSIERTLRERIPEVDTTDPRRDLLQELLRSAGHATESSRSADDPRAEAEHRALNELVEALAAWIDRTEVDPPAACRRAYRLVERDFVAIASALAPDHGDALRALIPSMDH
jgi:type VI secretion system protein ImpA